MSQCRSARATGLEPGDLIQEHGYFMVDLLEGGHNVHHQGIVRLTVLYSCNFAPVAFNKNGPAMIVGQTEIFYITERVQIHML